MLYDSLQENGKARRKSTILFHDTLIYNFLHRLTHELVLPIWKSNVSLTLMIDKKAKRFVNQNDIL